MVSIGQNLVSAGKFQTASVDFFIAVTVYFKLTSFLLFIICWFVIEILVESFGIKSYTEHRPNL